MLEMKLLLLLGICLAVVVVNGFVVIKFCCSCGRGSVPVVIVPLTRDMETPEFIVRNCVYGIAERCPETIVAAIDLGADSETMQIFEKLMGRSCSYEIIKADGCSENICRFVENIIKMRI